MQAREYLNTSSFFDQENKILMDCFPFSFMDYRDMLKL